MRAASLKRKLEELEDAGHAIHVELRKIERELERYNEQEMALFVGSRCERIIGFSDRDLRKFTFDNGLTGYIAHDFSYVEMRDNTGEIGTFYERHGMNLINRGNENLVDGMKRLDRLSKTLPTIDHLIHNVFPAWLEVSAHMDVEVLMTARVLRWIAQQLPRDNQWPDIVEGKFPMTRK